MNMEVDSTVPENDSAEVMATSLSKDETMAKSEDGPLLVKEEFQEADDASAEARVNGNTADAASANTAAPVPNSATLKSPPKDESPKQLKRRASRSPSLEIEEFRGFAKEESIEDKSAVYRSIVGLISAQVKDEETKFTPLRRIAAQRSVKRLRTEEGSRPSSALSHRSEGEAVLSSPLGGRRRVAPESMSLPQYRVPIEHGWKRELVYRATPDVHQRRNADIYYYTPAGKKLRSTREVSEHLAGTGLTLDNFTFFKEPLGLDDPEKEIIRDAKQRDSPASSPAPVPQTFAEGKRVPKPKAPKGASPIHSPLVAPLKLKVKSQGSRLSSGRGSIGEKVSTPSTPTTPTVKKISAAGTPNGEASGRRRGRPSATVDHFTQFYKKSQEPAFQFDVVSQIFQYLGMRDLARCARVCRLWRDLAATPSLWRHVRMKNSQVSDWRGLCAALAKRGTQRLDLRKMLLPQQDDDFWRQFADNLSTVTSLERVELCRCPSSAVEAVCRSLPKLKQLGALAVRDPKLNPAPLANLKDLESLRIKSMNGLILTSDLTALSNLSHLQHLSLTSIKELGAANCAVVVGSLRGLVSLELGECTFGAEFGVALGKLTSLQLLRLERGTADCDAPAILEALAALPALKQLELVNFDIKPGFDDALGKCRNIQRLLIIPTYVSQSATTNRQVLSGVLKLKDTLTHLMWGVTIELLRVTELFIDQCEGGIKRSKLDGQSIPVLKPVPGYGVLGDTQQRLAGPPQVEILPLPTLQSLLLSSLPNTKLKLLKIPFHATWRQSLADFQ